MDAAESSITVEFLSKLELLSNPVLMGSQAASGLSSAMLLILVSVGISLIFGVARIINLAHGAFYMLGAYVMSTVCENRVGLLWFTLGVLCSAIVAGLIGAAFEKGLVRKIYKEGPQLQIMLTFGFLLAMNTFTELVWGTELRKIERPEAFDGSVNFLGVVIPKYNLVLVFIAFALIMALWCSIRFTLWGQKIRALSFDREMLQGLGSDVSRLSTQVFSVACVLAGVAGALSAPLFAVNLNMGAEISLNSFVTVIIGGMGSIFGVFWAAILIGQAQAFGILIAPTVSGFFPYIVMVLVLIFRPRGLFGGSEKRKNEGD